MQDDYRDRWCQFYAALLSGEAGRGDYQKDVADARKMGKLADEALAELKARDKKKAFDEPEKGYRD